VVRGPIESPAPTLRTFAAPEGRSDLPGRGRARRPSAARVEQFASRSAVPRGRARSRDRECDGFGLSPRASMLIGRCSEPSLPRWYLPVPWRACPTHGSQ